MKIDLTDFDRGCESERGSALTAIALRIRALNERFPSASQGLLSILDQAVVSGTSFLSAAIIGRMTAPDELGLYYLVLSIVIIVSAVQDNVVAAPYMVYGRRQQGRELAEYSGSVWIYYFAVSAMTVLGLLAIIAILSVTSQSKMTPGLLTLVGAGPLILLRQGLRRFAFANVRVKAAIALDTVVAAVQLGGLVLLGHFGQLSLGSIFAVMGGACGLACLGSYLLDPQPVRFVRGRFMPDWRINWAFAKWALRSYLIGNTTPYVMLWILGTAVGAASAGVFGACATLIGMTNVVLIGVDNVLTPQAAHAFATGRAKQLLRVLTRTAALLILTLGGFSLFVLATGDWLAVFVFGASYQGTGAILLALALTALMSSIGVIAGNGLWAIDQPRSSFLADAICMTVTLIAVAILILPFGALGAALASLTGMTAGAVVRTTVLGLYLRHDAADHSARASQVETHTDAPAAATGNL